MYLLVLTDSHASALLHRIELHGITHEGPSKPSHASWLVAGFGQVRLFPARLVNGMAISGSDPGITSSGTACNPCGGLTAPSPGSTANRSPCTSRPLVPSPSEVGTLWGKPTVSPTLRGPPWLKSPCAAWRLGDSCQVWQRLLLLCHIRQSGASRLRPVSEPPFVVSTGVGSRAGAT